MRSMSSILADEPSIHTMPVGGEGDGAPAEGSSSEPKADSKGETPEPKPKAAEAAPAAPGGDDEPEEPTPADLDGLKRALAASRGDKRKARAKWQETERKLAVLEGELNVLRRQATAQPAQQPEERPAQPTDAELDDEFWKIGAAAFLRKYGQPQHDPNQVATATKIQLSVYHAKKAHADYDEKRAAFQKAADKNPQLWEQANQSPDPAGFVYDHGTQFLELEPYGGDLNAWREAERAKIRAELGSGQKPNTAQPQPAAPAPTIPKSIAGARGSGAGGTREWAGPRPLSDLFRTH